MADIIDVVAKDWRYTSQQIREAVDHALIQGAVDGVTSINHARPHLPAWATGPQVAAWFALSGAAAAKGMGGAVLREGTEDGYAYLNLGNLEVERRITADGKTSLKVYELGEDGLKSPVQRPQAVLDGLRAFGLDPVETPILKLKVYPGNKGALEEFMRRAMGIPPTLEFSTPIDVGGLV